MTCRMTLKSKKNDIMITKIDLKFEFQLMQAASWRKRLGARLPPLGSRVRVSVPPCGFRGGRNGVWVGFSRGFSRFPYHQFHSTISPPSSHPFRFISSALVLVHQAWSAGTLATHGPILQGLHRISSLEPTLCWTRVEDIQYNCNYLGISDRQAYLIFNNYESRNQMKIKLI